MPLFSRNTTPTQDQRNRSRQNRPTTIEEPSEDLIPLSLCNSQGTPWMNFTSEVVDTLRNMLSRIARSRELPARMAIVSAVPDEGVSYVARALATVMANDMAARICLVELNWWNNATPNFNQRHHNGLVSVVSGEKRFDEVFINTSLPNLTIVPSGYLERADRPVMARSNVLKSGMDVLSRHFDHLILDIPAIRATNDAIPLTSLADSCIVVIKQGLTPVESIRLALDEIAHLNVLGTILNQVHYHTPARILQYIPQD